MRKISKKAIGLLLVIVLCFSMMPMSVMATDNTASTGTAEQTPDDPGDGITKEAEPGDPATDEGQEDFGPNWPEVEEETPTPIEAELVKTVNRPLVQVEYHYFDEADNQSITDFADYTVASTHSYNALALANGESITIAANKFPDKVAVSTDAMRFRVLLNGSEDITTLAAYDAGTGLVTLPSEYMGHAVTVVWYCPASEIVELPVTVIASVYENGGFTDSTQEITVASNAGTISVPFTESNGLVVSQNGIDLDESMYSVDGGSLNISASALGGDIAITAYTPVMRAMSGGVSTMGATSQVVHTRSADQIFYGYYTSYYTANGNTAFCLDPTVSGLNAGTYDVSGYLERGTGYDDLIKAAYYLYGGPGYNSVKNNLFDNPDTMEAYGLCHAAVAYMWMDNAEAFKGLSSSTIQHLLNLIAAINSQPMPPTGFEIFLYNVGSSTNQSLMSWEYTPTGNLEIQKVSGDPAKTDDNALYSLENAIFAVYNGSDTLLGRITTDANGKGTLNDISANETGLYIVEETPPAGYAENTEKIPFEIVAGETTTKVIENIPQGDPVTILLKKLCAETETNTAQGNTSLEGALFTIKYYKGGYYTESELQGKTPARTWTVRTDEYGFAMYHLDYMVAGSDPLYYASNGTTPTIPAGTVTVQEAAAPTGFLLNDELFVLYSKVGGVKEYVNTYNAPLVPDTPIRGGVAVSKRDFELDRPSQPQGDSDLQATFDIYNRSAGNVIVNGKSYAPNTVCATIITDAVTGLAATANDLLVYGDYEIVERANGGAPTGYLNTGKISQKFSITEHGKIVNLQTNAGAIKNNIKKGSLYLEKWDAEINRNESQGSGFLDVTVEIVNIGKHLVLVDGVEYQPGEVVYTMTLDKEGRGSTPEYFLPYSTYLVRETAVSEGYLATGVLQQVFEIREHGETVKLNTSDTAIKNDPIRGDLKGVKISDGDGKRLAGVPFTITSVTTGESHTVITDKNGMFSTESSWNPHSQNINRGETDRDGVWFGELWTLDDDNGALLYDTYLLEEQPCEANADRELLSFEVSIYRHLTVVDLGTVTNDYIQTPEIFTTARDQETTTGDAFVSGETTILDTVYYSGLVVGREYTLKGTLMDKETGDPLYVGASGQLGPKSEDDQQPIEVTQTFRALSETGSVTMEFTVNSLALVGKSVVVFESLEYEGKEIAVHANIEDEGQTVTFHDPQIGTSAAGIGGEKELDALPEIKIVDTVSFNGLIPGQTYHLTGTLMDKETGEAILSGDGEPVVAEKPLSPTSRTVKSKSASRWTARP